MASDRLNSPGRLREEMHPTKVDLLLSHAAIPTARILIAARGPVVTTTVIQGPKLSGTLSRTPSSDQADAQRKTDVTLRADA